MTDTVSRKKYQNIKRKATQWREKAIEAFDEIRKLQEELDSQEGDDPELLGNLKLEKSKLSKENEFLRHSMRDDVFKQEREICRKNGEIDRLNMSLNDYKERYQEIREDNKELRNSARVQHG
jgi:predicted RNase H-like nuclease (RuvC/YqgF family)